MSDMSQKIAQEAAREGLEKISSNLLKTAERLRKAEVNYKQAASKLQSHMSAK